MGGTQSSCAATQRKIGLLILVMVLVFFWHCTTFTNFGSNTRESNWPSRGNERGVFFGFREWDDSTTGPYSWIYTPAS